MFHVPSLSANLFLVSQLTKTRKLVKFCIDQFLIKNLKDGFIVTDGTFDPNG